MLSTRSALLSSVALAFAVGCADPDLGGGSTTQEVRAAKTPKALRVETCDGTEPIVFERGAKLVLDAPSSFTLDEVMSVPVGFAEPWTESAGGRGRTLYTFDTGAAPEELFVRLGRFHFTRAVGSGSTVSETCVFQGKLAGWSVVRSSEWTVGDSYAEPTVLERDLGEIPVGGGLLVEGSPFDLGNGSHTWLIEGEGLEAPIRTTQLGEGGSGTYVFSPDAPGEYRFDLRLVAEGYGNSLTHARFRVTE